MVIEAAHFDAMTIARTSRRHKLSSEASRRFERGVDPAAAYAAAHRVAPSCWSSWPAGTLVAAETVVGRRPAAPPPRSTTTCPGASSAPTVDPDTVVDAARPRSAPRSAVDGIGTLTITPPSWRPDLTDPYDYVEEVGRLIGYDTIAPVVPRAPVGRGLTRGPAGPAGGQRRGWPPPGSSRC